MGDRERNSQGQFNDRIPPEQVRKLFDEQDDPNRPLTANDVVDELGIARRTAHNKLNALVDRGDLATRKVGARGRVWWVPADTDDRDTDESKDDVEISTGVGARTRAESDHNPDAGDSPASSAERDEQADTPPDDG